MTGKAVEKVNKATGEIVSVESFDLNSYLSTLSSSKSLEQQKALAAAYDAACHALIGPGDVQQDGNRTFKKKSAWRKLQRHFNLSTEIVKVERSYQEVRGEDDRYRMYFVATVTVRASAPWGQYSEAVGACGQDEETGKRKITIADAVATAETRATNRAISNLIAMGEVSAEEMGDRRDVLSQPVVPFGRDKGKPLADLPNAGLNKLRAWCVEDEEKAKKFARLVGNIDVELDKRNASNADPDSYENMPEAMEEEDDDLPF